MSTERFFLSAVLLLASSVPTSAATVTIDTGQLYVTYDPASFVGVGTPSAVVTQIVFRPGLQVVAPADEQYYYASEPFQGLLQVAAHEDVAITGYSMTASGSAYVGDDAYLGIVGTFNESFYGASYYSGAFSGDGSWSGTNGNVASSPTSITFDGNLFVETTNNYSYEDIIGYEPYYEMSWEVIGYGPLYDDEGNVIGEEPIYDYIERYLYDVPVYGTFFQTSGGSITFDLLVIDISTTAVPLPASGILLAAGFGFVALWHCYPRRR